MNTVTGLVICVLIIVFLIGLAVTANRKLEEEKSEEEAHEEAHGVPPPSLSEWIDKRENGKLVKPKARQPLDKGNG